MGAPASRSGVEKTRQDSPTGAAGSANRPTPDGWGAAEGQQMGLLRGADLLQMHRVGFVTQLAQHAAQPLRG